AVVGSMFFNSGDHETLRVTTSEGFELTGTLKHPVLCLVDVAGVRTLWWKLFEEIAPGDRVALFRGARQEQSVASLAEIDAAVLAGAWVSEGFVNERRAGFNNVDAEY